jgi:hypothetical protein
MSGRSPSLAARFGDHYGILPCPARPLIRFHELDHRTGNPESAMLFAIKAGAIEQPPVYFLCRRFADRALSHKRARPPVGPRRPSPPDVAPSWLACRALRARRAPFCAAANHLRVYGGCPWPRSGSRTPSSTPFSAPPGRCALRIATRSCRRWPRLCRVRSRSATGRFFARSPKCSASSGTRPQLRKRSEWLRLQLWRRVALRRSGSQRSGPPGGEPDRLPVQPPRRRAA